MKLPAGFIHRMEETLGAAEFALFMEALEEAPVVSFRVNSKKNPATLPYEKVNWCDHAYFLNERPVFAADPWWHSGVYYVQEASSMILEQAFKTVRQHLETPLKILDLCAAPGGKSTHLASLCNEEDILVCNETIRSRVAVLTENLRKQGYPNIIISSADSKDFEQAGEIFDVVLVDAPCSGEGLFRKDPESVREWSREHIQTCELRQKRILEAAVNCMKPGGILIYCTCTYNPGENEKQVEQVLKRGFEPLYFELNREKFSSFQCYPQYFRGEGFYMAVLRKIRSVSGLKGKIKRKSVIKTVKNQSAWDSCLNIELPVFAFGDRLLAGSKEIFDFQREFLSGIYCSAIGTELGTLKENRFIPSEYLPFSLLLRRDNFHIHEIDYETALNFFHKIPVPYSGILKGYVLLTYKNQSIGFGKFAGNRINNLFPAEWKLRKIPLKDQWFSLAGL